MWFFAPPSAWTRFPALLAVLKTCSATGVEPTKLTAATCGCSRSAETATRSPWTTLRTPSGSPASLASSARRSPHEGSFSEGLRTNVFPQAIDIGNIQSGTMAGKLKGVIPTQTPSGWRMDQESIPEPTLFVNSPLRRWGIPQANSTTSRPRVTEPFASESTFPCSEVTIAASASRFFSMRSLNRKRTRARRSGGVAAHAGKARAAAATALETSSAEAKATFALTCPVAGS